MKYIKRINELHTSNLSEQELLEMANLNYKYTGIENVILWVGPNPGSHSYRIKVSNIPNKFEGKDCFTLTIPDYEVVGNMDTKFITNKVLSDIKKWCELNIEVIKEYSNYEISTGDLIERIKPI